MEQNAIQALLRDEAAKIFAEGDEDERSNEQKLIDALDAASLRFSAIMLDDRTNEHGQFLIDWDMRVEVFKMIRDWVATRRRTDIDDPRDNQKGVQSLQAELAAGKAAHATPKQKPGKYVMPKRGRGRPSTEEKREREALERRMQAERDRDERGDDSAMKNLMSHHVGAQS